MLFLVPKYLDNSELLVEIRRSRALQAECPELPPAACVTDRLARMLVELVDRFARRSEFQNCGTGYVEDMKSAAVLRLLQAAMKFDPEKSSNAFSYLTRTVENTCKTFGNKERTQSRVREAMTVHQSVAGGVNSAWAEW